MLYSELPDRENDVNRLFAMLLLLVKLAAPVITSVIIIFLYNLVLPIMKLLALGVVVLAVFLTGCVTEPVVGVPVAPVIPAGVTYVAPTYVRPGPGYLWSYHVDYGWGWHHPNRGWHRGWR